jgi:hypothetical protein
MVPGEQVAHDRPLPLVTVHVSATVQLAIVPQSTQALLFSQVPTPQAVHAPVPSPTKPAAHDGQMSLLPVVTLQVSTEPQLAIVPQSIQALLLSQVPEAQRVQEPVPSPT